jgi:hypothetical protein
MKPDTGNTYLQRIYDNKCTQSHRKEPNKFILLFENVHFSQNSTQILFSNSQKHVRNGY